MKKFQLRITVFLLKQKTERFLDLEDCEAK